MTENELQKGDSETEILSADDEKLRLMCNGLKKVGAPKNFDFHLKARIAKANPEDFQTASLVPFLRYLLPFSVVILLAVFVGFNIFLTSKNNEEIVQATVQPQKLEESPIVSSPTANNSTATANYLPTPANFIVAEDKMTASANTVKKAATSDIASVQNSKKEVLPKSKEDDKTLSRDMASGTGEILTPNGITLPEINKPTVLSTKSADSVKQIFNFIGITAVFESEKWKVTAVDGSNMAARAGIRVGDLIEAIDGNKLGSAAMSNHSFNVKVIQVIRNGKNISLEMNK
ncbi:MAG: hypothetical protein LUM44_00230 [Pyrinomonadaceae bacterium]|nr:hypothetical protein [Pyrinomonadaceae bacterium]